jgi:lipoic acid synthetase
MFSHIVPCGIPDKGVTSMARLLGREVDLRAVVDRVVGNFEGEFGAPFVDRHDVAWRHSARDLAPFTRDAMDHDGASRPTPPAQPVRLLGRLADAGVEPVHAPGRRPDWMRVRARMDGEFLELKRLVRGLELHTVCEEAGCPNIYECWADRTATFMILGDRCTRACGFCLIDTSKPLPVDPDEPRRVAEAVRTLGLAHAVITCVARDDLADGGASAFAGVVAAIRATSPDTNVELLISDCRGDDASLATIFDARPDVLNHNLETVARLQRAARPSAGYARSLSVLARAKDADLVTKSGLIVGMGETDAEVQAALDDLRGVGVDIVTIGQYLRPTERHLPVVRWWTPEQFEHVGAYARTLGFAHVESGPLVRSSYHARSGAEAAVPAALRLTS